MRALAAVGLFLAASATAPALWPYGLALVGSATLSFGPCHLVIYVEGEAAGALWAFTLAGDSVVSYACVEDPLIFPDGPYLGWGDPRYGMSASPPICCFEKFIYFDGLEQDTAGAVSAVHGDFTYCNIGCHTGEFRGTFVDAP